MDAQNAVVPASTKPPAASLKQPGSDLDHHHNSSAEKETIDFNNVPTILRDSIPVSRRDLAHEGDGSQDGDSDTETVVLPGKDGYSPSKVRKIKNEDHSENGDGFVDSSVQRRVLNNPKLDLDQARRDRSRERDGRDRADRIDKATVAPPAPENETSEGKNNRLLLYRPEKPHSKDGSSGLSSAPASPPPQQRRWRASVVFSDSESETGQGFSSSKTTTNDRSRVPDKLVLHKRKASKAESDDEAENRKIRRQRMSGSGLNASRSNSIRDPKLNPSKPHHENSTNHNLNNKHSAPRNRSASPPVRSHRRSISTHLPSQPANGLGLKKKRIPAPLQTTEYQSDDSSASGSTQARSSKLRHHHLATPATTESAISPVKMAPHKKHLDAHGQTFLARACAKGDYPLAKQRLQERPQDINYADYAGNSPLQIAAINGHVDIVKLLVDAGCDLDVYNNEKDTPLMDAVENNHLDVVKILLAAGVNPRKANAIGQEPIDNIDDENKDAAEMRELLKEARQRFGQRRRTSEEHHTQDHTDGVSSHGQESPRRSPGPSSSAFANAASRRAGTVRATKTSNHLLYMPMDDKTLRQAAARGDEETVMRILQVRDKFDDPEAMVNAAKAGHETVINLLLALSGANPDPKPIPELDEEISTPMLAAIGQEGSLKVIKLLLAQGNFDPTRRFKGETYYEIARRRKGLNCEVEEDILKEAYDNYKKTHKDSSMSKSDRDLQRSRTDQKEGASKAHKRKASSPAREPKKANTGKTLTSSPKEKRRSNSFHVNQDDQTSPKRGPGRPKKEDRIPAIAVSDREASPAASKRATKVIRIDSELAASSEGESIKPRRKLVSRRELNGEREKQQQRRTSLTSNASSLKESLSPHEPRRDEPSEKQHQHHQQQQPPQQPSQKGDKHLDRTKTLKRDDSRDRLSVSGENSGKRHRTSTTPPRLGSSDKEGSEAPSKKRQRLDVEGKEKRRKPSVSPDDRPHVHKPTSSRPNPTSSVTAPPVSKAAHKASREDGERKAAPKLKKPETDVGPREGKPSTTDKSSLHVKREDSDVQMRDADRAGDVAESRTHPDKENEQVKQPSQPTQSTQQKETLQEAMRKAQERKEKDAIRKAEEKARKLKEEKERERRQKEEEEAKQRLEEEKRVREEEERRKRKEEEDRKAKEEEERRKQEEEERRRREEELKRQRLEAERKQKEEEERRRQEEEARLLREEKERKKRAEEEKRRKEEEDRKKQLEEEQRKRDEEERLRREKLEREAAEEAARLKEEEERKMREETERKHREEMERRRAAREAERLAELHRIHLEQERLRLSKLPPVLRWLDGSPNPKLAEVARQFTPMQGVRYDCIRPETTGTVDGREQWILNTQVALLLGEKDLTLSRYTAWQHIPVSDIAKQVIWRLEADRYALTSPTLHDLGRQIPGYYPEEPEHMGNRLIEKLRRDAWAKFAAMDMFFVKASDLMFIVPTIPHLRSVEVAIAYRELPEHESQLRTWAPLQKWKSDPDASRFRVFAPRNKYYVNGELAREDLPGLSATSNTPFAEKRVPRKGLVAVSPTDPDYYRLCREQGLSHLVEDACSFDRTDGFRSPPAHDSSGSASPTSGPNGASEQRPMSPSSDQGAAKPRPLVNGVNGHFSPP